MPAYEHLSLAEMEAQALEAVDSKRNALCRARWDRYSAGEDVGRPLIQLSDFTRWWPRALGWRPEQLRETDSDAGRRYRFGQVIFRRDHIPDDKVWAIPERTGWERGDEPPVARTNVLGGEVVYDESTGAWVDTPALRDEAHLAELEAMKHDEYPYGSTGAFGAALRLRGLGQFLIDMLDAPDFARRTLEFLFTDSLGHRRASSTQHRGRDPRTDAQPPRANHHFGARPACVHQRDQPSRRQR